MYCIIFLTYLEDFVLYGQYFTLYNGDFGLRVGDSGLYDGNIERRGGKADFLKYDGDFGL